MTLTEQRAKKYDDISETFCELDRVSGNYHNVNNSMRPQLLDCITSLNLIMK